jgi:hypothetical protein
MRANRVGDVAWGKMSIVPFSHPSVGMAKLRGNDA